jgi:putative PIN family toxin of toxin-antitoxin system
VRIVADTNVLVSALIFPGGPPEAVYRLALERQIVLVTSRPLLAELGRVLTAKFGWDVGRSEEAVRQLVRVADIAEPQQPVVEIQADPADNRVREAAAEGRVEAIVSGDRHLLALVFWRGIRIASPAVFLATL